MRPTVQPSPPPAQLSPLSQGQAPSLAPDPSYHQVYPSTPFHDPSNLPVHSRLTSYKLTPLHLSSRPRLLLFPPSPSCLNCCRRPKHQLSQPQPTKHLNFPAFLLLHIHQLNHHLICPPHHIHPPPPQLPNKLLKCLLSLLHPTHLNLHLLIKHKRNLPRDLHSPLPHILHRKHLQSPNNSHHLPSNTPTLPHHTSPLPIHHHFTPLSTPPSSALHYSPLTPKISNPMSIPKSLQLKARYN